MLRAGLGGRLIIQMPADALEQVAALTDVGAERFVGALNQATKDGIRLVAE